MTPYALIAALQWTHPGVAPAAPEGLTVGGVLGWIAAIAIVLGVALLILVEFVWKHRVARTTYRWLLLLGLLVLPAFALLGSAGAMTEGMKAVESCNSCHVMNAFVDDMNDPRSPTLAARHATTGFIPSQQCYACHTGYGIFGTAEARRDGFRHWLLYATRTWDEPITFKGAYPNANCLACHGNAPRFQEVESHRALAGPLAGDEMSCHSCHGLPHPSRPERTAAEGNRDTRGAAAGTEVAP